MGLTLLVSMTRCLLRCFVYLCVLFSFVGEVARSENIYEGLEIEWDWVHDVKLTKQTIKRLFFF